MNLNGAEILIRCLKEQNVDTVFGYPGGCVLDIYDAIYRDGSLRHILTAHEQGAAHAADGYARATGKTGVCIATSGPGATNLVTGIATAYMDSIPLVAITGNVTVSNLGRDSFQEVDIAGITMPITKHNYIVKDIHKLASTIREAFYIANSGRKGPVLIDIPKNIQTEICEFTPSSPSEYKPKAVNAASLSAVCAALERAKRPLILAGGGCIGSNASENLFLFAKRLQAPVCATLMGLGSYPASDEQFLGMIGMHGTDAAAKAFRRADTVIACGMRFSDRVAGNRIRFGENKTVIQFDIDAAEIDKNVQTDLSVMADIDEIFKAILPVLAQGERKEWLKEIAAYKEYETSRFNCRLPAYKIISALRTFTDADTRIATTSDSTRCGRRSIILLKNLALSSRAEVSVPWDSGWVRRSDPASGATKNSSRYGRRIFPHESQRALYGGIASFAPHHPAHGQQLSGHGTAMADVILP